MKSIGGMLPDFKPDGELANMHSDNFRVCPAFKKRDQRYCWSACAGCKKPLRLIFALLANFHGVMRFFRVP